MASFTTFKKSLNQNPDRLQAFENCQPYLIKDTENYVGDFHAITIIGSASFTSVTAVDADNNTYDWLSHTNIEVDEVLDSLDGFTAFTAANKFTGIQLTSGKVLIHR